MNATRRTFLGLIAAALAWPKNAFGKIAAGKPRPCACCYRQIADKPFIKYDRAKFVPQKGEYIAYDQIEWGASYALCHECFGHVGVMSVPRRRDRITAFSLRAELINQERTPTDEGFFRALTDAYTLYLDVTLLGAAQTVLDKPDGHGVEIVAAAVAHFKNGEWALVPQR